MSILAIIPARMGSSRFPNKPMALINGVPMIEIVYQNTKKSLKVSDVIVATCDEQILKHINSIGGKAIITSKKHKRASDRCAEALLKYEKKYRKKISIVVMVQGDEPLVKGKMIDKAVILMMKNKKINIVNLMCKISSKKDFYDENCVKVLHNKSNEALIFSRSPIPFLKKFDKKFVKKQVCVIPFRRNFLLKYNKIKPTELERLESIDMLRLLENNYKINLLEISKETFPVDNKYDLNRVKLLLKKNK